LSSVCNLVSFRKPIDVGEASLPVRERDHDGKLEALSKRVGRMSQKCYPKIAKYLCSAEFYTIHVTCSNTSSAEIAFTILFV
jgi:hypothetical protein